MIFKDRVSLITGASQGIGEAIALDFAAEGATVLLVDIQKDKLDEVARRIAGAGGRAAVFAADVAKLDAATRRRRRGRPDVRQDRPSRQQRRDHPGQPLHADEGGGVGRRHRRQPEGRLQLLQGRHPEHGSGPLRPDRQPVVGRRGHGQRRPGQLLGLEGRAHRTEQVPRPRGRRRGTSPSIASPPATSPRP